MNFRNKLIPVALVAALLGGSVGAFVMRPSKNTETAAATTTTANAPVASKHSLAPAATTVSNDEALSNVPNSEIASLSDAEKAAYREGFADGVRASCEEGINVRSGVTTQSRARTTERVVYQPVTRTRTVRSSRGSSSNARRVYYNYEQPRKRSFWSKHRDKLTVAMGAGGGAVIGGLIGGKKGAAIGALAGGGGSALYTYKLRKRDRRY